MTQEKIERILQEIGIEYRYHHFETEEAYQYCGKACKGNFDGKVKKKPMTQEKIERILQEIGIEYRYHHFETEEAVNPPFICWLIPGSNNFSADGKVYFKSNKVNIELYTDQKDFELEKQV